MYTKSVTSSSNNISDLIAKVMDRFDTDKDGFLSSGEFSDFLTGLLGGGPAATSSAMGGQAGMTTPTIGRGAFRSTLAGFDSAKIDDSTIQGANTSKYRAARIFQDFKPMPESLSAVIERLQAEGVNARQVSFDKIDFGDGYGPIDVIQGAYPGGGVAWQWLPQGA
ncbi:MAG: hypothetical protein A3J29_02060 [Acidobacteria bacterium RIFCSPLOWO2_12_FULL_67_14b]|nr:MAG: hypothetical protein A3J29_02060 [Acidobacteria bacterium RIFCSPLOWO2_12_FULL_67_14b]